MPILSMERVAKHYGDVAAVSDLTFAPPDGQICGFLGGNGAGKTTTLKMALGILQPSSGAIRLFGAPPNRATRARVGFLPEERALYQSMTPLELIPYFGRLKGMSRRDAIGATMALLYRLDLETVARKRIDLVSKGTAQRVQLACAVVNNPQLLILDEPFSGLDPAGQDAIEGLVKELARLGTTIIFSTHVLPQAERLCDHIVVLSRGRKVFDGPQAEARRQMPSKLLVVAQDDPSCLPPVLTATLLEELADGWRRWQVKLVASAAPEDLWRASCEAQLPMREFSEQGATLQDVFAHLTSQGSGQ